MTIIDEITIQQIALRLGCTATAVRSGLDMPDYPPDLLAARREGFKRQMREYDEGSDGLWKPDPDTVDGASNLSDWEDERNSRPLPL
jgi:hypothetical protein